MVRVEGRGHPRARDERDVEGRGHPRAPDGRDVEGRGHPRAPDEREAAQPVFYYDLGDPACYLAAERVMGALPVVAEWEPVWAPRLAGATGLQAPPPAAWPQGRREREWFEAQAAAHGLQPFRWPARPPHTREAMLAATYAKQIGRAVAFSLAAFRQTFAAGRDLGERDTLLIAGAACEMHPAALLKALELRSVLDALEAAGARAAAAGVSRLPAIRVGQRVFAGVGALEAAAEAIAQAGERRLPRGAGGGG